LRAGDGVTGVPALAAAACDRAEAGCPFAAGGADGAGHRRPRGYCLKQIAPIQTCVSRLLGCGSLGHFSSSLTALYDGPTT
jgi:hypothetical protein